MSIDKQLRMAVSKCGLSILQVSIQADVPYAAVHGFMRSSRDIRLSTAVKIAKLVGVEFKPIKKRKGR